jgi:hypothetical protein
MVTGLCGFLPLDKDADAPCTTACCHESIKGIYLVNEIADPIVDGALRGGVRIFSIGYRQLVEDLGLLCCEMPSRRRQTLHRSICRLEITRA